MKIEDKIQLAAEHIEAFIAHVPEDWSSVDLANHLVRNQAQEELLAIDVPELISERAALVRRRSREAIEALRGVLERALEMSDSKAEIARLRPNDPSMGDQRYSRSYNEPKIRDAEKLLTHIDAERVLDDLED